ncbi:hypothetical protein [Microbispora hainanensis]|uniref:Uncharacterized protein n=1 Tax=Microbispora hainanensis TaxID=568844 RepID=A0A544YVH8_9ACTN|nr:hypothetical protein [Microbispora hainanensis]TQS20767.1 hypothetical protein FLX08_14945 [Microbispora hainanensis]
MAVIHRERMAWESARIFVAAATADAYWWLGETLGRRLGQAYERDLARTRVRLQREEAEPVQGPRAAGEDVLSAEVGAWRARIEDVLTERPELAAVLRQVIEETGRRMGHRHSTGPALRE